LAGEHIVAIESDILTTMKAEPLEAVARRIRDGDILLCSCDEPFSKLIRWATKSPWSHIALAYRWQGVGRVMVFEAVQKIGVRTVPLSSFISRGATGKKPFPGKILLARHADYADKGGGHGSAAMKRLADFAVDRFGDPFAPGEILKIGLRVALGRLHRTMPKMMGPDDEFICSEYVAKCYEAVGITIDWDGRGFIAPADFANDPKVRAIAQIEAV
jgi:hypothetical protein